MDGSRATAMQLQLRHNAEDLQDYLRDLETWESEIKKKDDSLRRQKPILKETLPPVRSKRSQATSKKKKKRPGPSENPPRISSYDFQSWDKFDVEKACEEVDYEVQSSSGSEEEEEEDEVLEEERRKQEALLEKEKGNVLFKDGKFELAVECYTMAMELDPLSAVMPANRALALLKLERYAAAESDCSVAIALDDSYVKAYLRRGTARTKLGKLKEAKEDFDAVLKLEPGNKQAKSDLMKLEKQLNIVENGSVPKSQKTPSAYVSAVKRPPHLRSKKPLKRIAIEEVGEDEPVARTDASQPSPTLTAQLVEAAGEYPKSPENDIPEVPSHDKDSSSAVQTGETRQSLEDGVGGNRAPSDDGDGHVVTEQRKEEAFRLPSVPDSSIQFQADWKSLRRNRTVLSDYFKALPPSKYPSLFQQSLETDIFPEIISILHEDYVRCGKLCLEQLRWLTKVKRFSVAVMFLSRKEKESLRQLFKDLHSLTSNDTDHLELQALAKVFSVKL